MIRDITTKLADRVKRIKPSPTIAINTKAKELQAAGKKIINLSIGEPDFDTPEHIKEAAIKALRDGHTKYTAVDGIKSLKEAIIKKFKNDNGLSYELNQILVSTGAKQSLFNIFSALLNEGDEVIIPAPYWVSYPDMVLLNDGTPVIVTTTQEDNFKLTAEGLKKAITNKTRILILNSPSNPTGKAYSEKELAQLGKVLLDYPDIIIATDDIYEKNMWHHTPFKNILNACPELYDRTIVVNGVSKAYAMTGWRIGYAAGPEKIISAMRKAQSQNTSNPNSIAQYAAKAALEGDQSCVDTMTKAYKERHDYVVAELNKIDGIDCTPSDGTFYAFPSVAKLIQKSTKLSNDLDFANFLLDGAEIAIVPGSAFGAEGYIRISYATSMENLVEAVERLKVAVDKL